MLPLVRALHPRLCVVQRDLSLEPAPTVVQKVDLLLAPTFGTRVKLENFFILFVHLVKMVPHVGKLHLMRRELGLVAESDLRLVTKYGSQVFLPKLVVVEKLFFHRMNKGPDISEPRILLKVILIDVIGLEVLR